MTDMDDRFCVWRIAAMRRSRMPARSVMTGEEIFFSLALSGRPAGLFPLADDGHLCIRFGAALTNNALRP
jgi:hypothetical protein